MYKYANRSPATSTREKDDEFDLSGSSSFLFSFRNDMVQVCGVPSRYSEFSLLREKLLVEIDQIEPFGRASHRRVEPAHHVARHRLVAKEEAVD